jgi:hypothetical protein
VILSSNQDGIREIGLIHPPKEKKIRGHNIWNNSFHVSGHYPIKDCGPQEEQRSRPYNCPSLLSKKTSLLCQEVEHRCSPCCGLRRWSWASKGAELPWQLTLQRAKHQRNCSMLGAHRHHSSPLSNIQQVTESAFMWGIYSYMYSIQEKQTSTWGKDQCR